MKRVLKQWRQCLFDPRSVAIVALAYMLTVLSGPFGTHALLDLESRLLFWGVVNVSGAALAILLRSVSLTYFPEDLNLRAEIVAAAVFTGIFGSGLVWWISYFTQAGALPGYDRSPLLLYGYVGFITFGVVFLRLLFAKPLKRRANAVDDAPEATPTPLAEAQPASEPRLLRRLEAADRGPVLWLSSQDHFVEVTTAKGSVKLRMRLKDAIAEMEGVPGHSVHRSHWVATSAIRSARKQGANWRLNLSNGAEVPVSRSFQPALDEAGLLGPLAAE